MDYGEILQKSWKIIWKFKVLWIFGFLASCGQGGGGSGGSPSYSSSWERSGSTPWNGTGNGEEFLGGLEKFFYQIGQGIESVPVWMWVAIGIGALLLILIIALVSLFIRTIGQIGLVRGVWLADEGAERLGFMELLRESFPYFWRVLLFTVLLTAVGWVIGFLLILPLFAFVILTLGLGLCCLIPLAILIGWAVSILVKQTVVVIVGEDVGVFEGLRRAWELIKNNPGAYAVMALILFGIGLVIGIILVVPVFLIFLPLMGGVVTSIANETFSGLAVGGGISLVLMCIYIPISIVLSSALQAYLGTAWTLTYRRLKMAGDDLEETASGGSAQAA